MINDTIRKHRNSSKSWQQSLQKLAGTFIQGLVVLHLLRLELSSKVPAQPGKLKHCKHWKTRRMKRVSAGSTKTRREPNLFPVQSLSLLLGSPHHPVLVPLFKAGSAHIFDLDFV